jgi:quercetin dioxygenase-like cupin family protein
LRVAVRIERWDVRLDGPLSEVTLQRKIEGLGFQIVARIYPAGLATTAPTDSREAIAAVVSGLVKLTIGGEPELLTAGDLAFIPPGVSRRLEVVGPGTALCLEAFRGAGDAE